MTFALLLLASLPALAEVGITSSTVKVLIGLLRRRSEKR